MSDSINVTCVWLHMPDQIFIKRLQLADDSAAKEFLRSTNAQMLEGGEH